MCFKIIIPRQFRNIIQLNRFSWNKFPIHKVNLQIPRNFNQFLISFIKFFLIFRKYCWNYCVHYFSSFLLSLLSGASSKSFLDNLIYLETVFNNSLLLEKELFLFFE